MIMIPGIPLRLRLRRTWKAEYFESRISNFEKKQRQNPERFHRGLSCVAKSEAGRRQERREKTSSCNVQGDGCTLKNICHFVSDGHIAGPAVKGRRNQIWLLPALRDFE